MEHPEDFRLGRAIESLLAEGETDSSLFLFAVYPTLPYPVRPDLVRLRTRFPLVSKGARGPTTPRVEGAGEEAWGEGGGEGREGREGIVPTCIDLHVCNSCSPERYSVL